MQTPTDAPSMLKVLNGNGPGRTYNIEGASRAPFFYVFIVYFVHNMFKVFLFDLVVVFVLLAGSKQ